jgi:hypothetical protein
MMGLQFFVWGSWLPLIYSYLPSLMFTPAEQAWILNTFPLAAIVGMFFSNQYANRHFAAERFLAFSHLAGGLAILLLAFTQSFWLFLGLMLLHCLLYVSTLSIVKLGLHTWYHCCGEFLPIMEDFHEIRSAPSSLKRQPVPAPIETYEPVIRTTECHRNLPKNQAAAD